MALALFGGLPPSRLREIGSAVGHQIAGVLDREDMAGIIGPVCQSAAFGLGDRVKTLRGSMRGIIVRVLEDGRAAIRPDGVEPERISLPENLLWDNAPGA